MTLSSTRRGDAAVLRRVWRLHFWIGLFAAPVLVVLALTGLVVLYNQPLDVLLNRGLLVVDERSTTVGLDEQVDIAVQQLGADYTLDAVIPPAEPGRSTRVDFIPPDAPEWPAGESSVTQVFVDPYTGDYLGQRSQLASPDGFGSQIHRLFGNDGPQIRLPSLGHLIAPSSYPEATIPVGIGNLLIEIAAVWILVLLASGIYLWWPRALETAKPLLTVRWGKGGRIRWRDLHALTGVLLAVVLIGYLLSGLTWSRYWGENWRAFSAEAAPSTEVEAASTPAQLGDYDRLGRRIAWAATDEAVPASQPAGPTAATLGYADIDQIAKDENMVPGYAIIPPYDSTADGEPTYGSYAVVNAWPQKLSEQRTLYLNQFTGETITNATAAQDGALARATSFGIAMHMGNQLGVLTRIIATMACLGVLLSVTTGVLMWWKRRPAGKTGLPRSASAATRADTPKKAVVTVVVASVVLAVVYPAFGVSLLAVLAVEFALGCRRRRGADDAPDDGTPVGHFGADEVSDDDGDQVPVDAQAR